MIFRRGLVLPVTFVAASSMFAGLFACSSSDTGSGVDTPDGAGDASTSPVDAGSSADGASSTSDATAGSCEGACKVTSLVIEIGAKKRTLVRAQFGTQQGAASAELHTESHLGGTPACPDQTSPSPDYTLIVSAIPRGAPGRKLSDRDGVVSSLFDFKGDLGLPPITKAVSVNLTVVDEDTATPPKWVALDVSAMFREGQVQGHLYAEYCPSLSR